MGKKLLNQTAELRALQLSFKEAMEQPEGDQDHCITTQPCTAGIGTQQRMKDLNNSSYHCARVWLS